MSSQLVPTLTSKQVVSLPVEDAKILLEVLPEAIREARSAQLAEGLR